MRLLLSALCLTAATAASAQSFPQFDEHAGYSVIGISSGGVLVDNAGTAFFCRVEPRSDRVAALTHCQALLGPVAASTALMAETAWLETQSGTADVIGELPLLAFVGAVRNVFTQAGCSIDGSDEDAVRDWFFPAIAAQLNIDPPLSDDVIDALEERLDDAFGMMLDDGEITVSSDTQMATLTTCSR